jgi:hypothetical protein
MELRPGVPEAIPEQCGAQPDKFTRRKRRVETDSEKASGKTNTKEHLTTASLEIQRLQF